MKKRFINSDNNATNAALGVFRQERPKGYIRKRFFALLIDFFAVALICQLLFALSGAPDWGGYLRTQEAVRGLPAGDPLVAERAGLYQQCFIITLAAAAVYEALTLLLFKGSPGKLIMGLRVVSAKEGAGLVKVKIWLALRSIIKALSLYLLSAIPFVILCLTVFSNGERRSGFDIFAGTKVTDIKEVGGQS